MERLIFNILSDFLYFANLFFIVTIIFVERRRPVYSVFWITILAFTSYLGFIAYLMFGLSFRKKRITKKFYQRNLFRRAHEDRMEGIKRLAGWEQLINYLEVTGKCRLTFSNEAKVFTQGEKLFKSIVEDISSAKRFIHLEYFIFSYDDLGREIGSLLMKKAREGVEVKMIIDGVGSRKLPKRYIKELEASGIDVETFFPLYLPAVHVRINYRTHRKILLIDGEVSYIGGFNIGDEYIGKGKLGKWRDTHLRLKGSITREIQKEFFSSWSFTKDQKIIKDPHMTTISYEVIKKYFPQPLQGEGCPIQVVGSAPDYDFRLIRDGFLKIITRAEKYIYIHTPYFIPDDTTYEALKLAALSGVKIKIIIPDKPDHMMVYWATLSFVGELLDYGIDFYTYNDGFLHSKMIVSDDTIASVGSSNFDHRSFHQNFEINAFLYDERLVKKLKKSFIEDLKVSTRISKEQYMKRKVVVKFKESISRLFSPIL